MKRFQRFADGWRFHGARPSYGTLPKVRNLEPVRLPIGGNSDSASEDRSKRRQCRAAYIIGRTLHPLADVANPWRDLRCNNAMSRDATGDSPSGSDNGSGQSSPVTMT